MLEAPERILLRKRVVIVCRESSNGSLRFEPIRNIPGGEQGSIEYQSHTSFPETCLCRRLTRYCCPNQLRSLLKREQEVRLAARVAALEAMGNHKIEAERQKAEQRRSLLLKLLQQSEFLRTALAAEGTAQVSQTQEDSLWMDGTGSPAEVTEGNGGLIERTRARYHP